jgi:hypothetical protein
MVSGVQGSNSVLERRVREECREPLPHKPVQGAVDSAVAAVLEDLADLGVVAEEDLEEEAADLAGPGPEEAGVLDKWPAPLSAIAAGEIKEFMARRLLPSRIPLSMPSHSLSMVSMFRKQRTHRADSA